MRGRKDVCVCVLAACSCRNVLIASHSDSPSVLEAEFLCFKCQDD